MMKWSIITEDFSKYIYEVEQVEYEPYGRCGCRVCYELDVTVLDWLKENMGEKCVDWLYAVDTDKVAKFYFADETNAMAFKLRWIY